MERSFISLLINGLPGLIAGIITGIIVLVIEYRTGWFIKRMGDNSSNVPITRYSGYKPPSFYRNNWFDLISGIIFFLLIFFLIFPIIGIMISPILTSRTSTILDNSKSPNVVVKNIGEGDSKSFFNNDLFLSVNDVSDGEVTYTVGRAGFQSQVIEKAKNGTSIVYGADNIKYDIRVTSIVYLSIFGKASADFAVTKMP